MDGETDITGDAAKEDRRHITAAVNRHGRRTSVSVSELLVRSALPDFHETERHKEGDHLAWLEDGSGQHVTSRHDDGLGTDEFGLHCRLSVVKEHGDNFPKVVVELFEGCALAVCAGKAGHISSVEARVRTTLYDGGVGVHRVEDSGRGTALHYWTASAVETTVQFEAGAHEAAPVAPIPHKQVQSASGAKSAPRPAGFPAFRVPSRSFGRGPVHRAKVCIDSLRAIPRPGA